MIFGRLRMCCVCSRLGHMSCDCSRLGRCHDSTLTSVINNSSSENGLCQLGPEGAAGRRETEEGRGRIRGCPQPGVCLWEQVMRAPPLLAFLVNCLGDQTLSVSSEETVGSLFCVISLQTFETVWPLLTFHHFSVTCRLNLPCLLMGVVSCSH